VGAGDMPVRDQQPIVGTRKYCLAAKPTLHKPGSSEIEKPASILAILQTLLTWQSAFACSISARSFIRITAEAVLRQSNVLQSGFAACIDNGNVASSPLAAV
jgi:hypothetical protein